MLLTAILQLDWVLKRQDEQSDPVGAPRQTAVLQERKEDSEPPESYQEPWQERESEGGWRLPVGPIRLPVAQPLVELPWVQAAGARPSALAFRHSVRMRLPVKPEAE